MEASEEIAPYSATAVCTSVAPLQTSASASDAIACTLGEPDDESIATSGGNPPMRAMVSWLKGLAMASCATAPAVLACA